MRLFSVGIVVHNAPDYTDKCLASVIEHSPPAETEICLWDNASDQETKKRYMNMLDRALKVGFETHIHQNETNRGFGYPVNELSRIASSDYFVMLNNDAVVGPGWLQKLRQPFLDYPMVGATGPGGGCHTLDEEGHGYGGAGIDYIEGSCMMVPRLLFVGMSGFDHDIFRFAYAEDADLGLRMKRAGYQLIEVALPGYKHERAVTRSAINYIRRETGEGPDLDGIQVKNNAKLLARWYAPYLQHHSMKRVIELCREGAVGDVFQLTALARIVAEKRPTWKLYAATPFDDFFQGNPYISPASALNGPRERLDFNHAYEKHPRLQVSQAYAKELGIDDAPKRMPELYLTKEERERALARSQIYDGAYIVVHDARSHWPGKNPKEGIIAQAVKLFLERHPGWAAAAVGEPHSGCPEGCEDWRGLSRRATIAAIGAAHCFIGPDMFPASGAYAMRTPAAVLFGAVPATRLIVEPAFAQGVVADGLACLGCHCDLPSPRPFTGCNREPGCEVAPCMSQLTPERIVDFAERAMAWRYRPNGAYTEWRKNPDLYTPYIESGKGLDVGCGMSGLPRAVTFDRTPYLHVDRTGDSRRTLPFGDGEFDWVSCSHHLEDLHSVDFTLLEMRRVLKHGGTFLAYVPTDKYTGCNEDHVRLFDEQSLRHILERNHLSVTRITLDEDDGRYSLFAAATKV